MVSVLFTTAVGWQFVRFSCSIWLGALSRPCQWKQDAIRGYGPSEFRKSSQLMHGKVAGSFHLTGLYDGRSLSGPPKTQVCHTSSTVPKGEQGIRWVGCLSLGSTANNPDCSLFFLGTRTATKAKMKWSLTQPIRSFFPGTRT
jgi:hypothetical protein